ncbi:hypothetical protein TNIN_468101 [Trichonephila inaurata madagascariensis]|uniref:Uncharacterized protein n=1 Tax=Trichonephila inaurata madagascariensis TaxID=2747483 RepID=A0A8X7C8J9_9ARAC|nr:hypothetical protein TNIN_468101 [Trichonephila inaurata madagascariensis]
MASTSSDQSLLYSEYLESDSTKRAVEVLERKNKKKPVMKFTKSPVLAKVIDLLARFKEEDEKLMAVPESERNIENIEDDSAYIEMNVALQKEGSSDSESDEEDTEINKSDKDASEHCKGDLEESSILINTEQINSESVNDIINNEAELPIKCAKRKVDELIEPELDQRTSQKICVLE